MKIEHITSTSGNKTWVTYRYFILSHDVSTLTDEDTLKTEVAEISTHQLTSTQTYKLIITRMKLVFSH